MANGDTNQGWGGLPAGTGEVISGTWGEAIMTPSGPASQGQLDVSGWGLPGYEGINWAYEAWRAKGGAAQFPTAPLTYTPPTTTELKGATFPTPTMFEFPFTGGMNIKEWARNEYGKVASRGIQDPYAAALYSLNFNALNNQHSLAGQYSSWSLPAQLALQNPKAQAIIQQAKDNNCDVAYSHLTDDSKAVFNVYPTTTTIDRGMVGKWDFNTVTGELEKLQPGQGAYVQGWIPSDIPITKTGDMYEMIDTFKHETDFTGSWLRTPIARERFENRDIFGLALTDDELKKDYAIDAPVFKVKSKAVTSYLTGELSLQDLVNQGVIPPTEMKDITDWVEEAMTKNWRAPVTPTAVSEGGLLLERTLQEIRAKYVEEYPLAFGLVQTGLSEEYQVKETARKEIEERYQFMDPLTLSNWTEHSTAMLQNYMGGIGKLVFASATMPYWVLTSLGQEDKAESIVGADLYWTPTDTLLKWQAGEKVSAKEWLATVSPAGWVAEYEKSTFPKFVKGAGEFIGDLVAWIVLCGAISPRIATPIATQLAEGKVSLKTAQLWERTMGKIAASYKGKAPKDVTKLAERAGKELLTFEKAIADLTVRTNVANVNQAASKVYAQEAVIKQLGRIAKEQKLKTGKISDELMNDIIEANNKRFSYMTGWQATVSESLYGGKVKVKAGELIPLETFEELEKSLLVPDRARGMAVAAARIPVLKHVLGGFNPSIRTSENLVRASAQKLTVSYQTAKQLADLQIAPLYVMDDVLGTVLREGANYGTAKNVEGIHHVLEVLQNPSKFRFAKNMGVWAGKKVSDHPQIVVALQLRNQIEGMIIKNDLPIELLKMQEGMEWMPRGMKNIVQSGLLSGNRKFHARPEQMSRVYLDISEGLEKGIAYDADWRMLLRKHMQNVYEINAEDMFAKAVKPLGSTAFPTQLEMELTAAKKTSTYLAKDVMDKLPQAKRMSPATLAAINRRAPGVAAAIKEGRPLAELQTIATKEAQAGRAYQARLQAEMDDVQKMKDIHGIPAFEGWKFPPEIAKEIQRSTRNSPIDPLTNFASQANSLIRMVRAGYDFGVGWIQGQILLARRSDIWGKAMVASAKSMADPAWAAGFAGQHQATIRDMIIRGRMALSSTEFMEGAGLLRKIPVIGKITGAFERQFNTFLDTARVYLWEAFERPGMSNTYAADLGAVIDNMMGTLSSAKLGIKPYQRAVEAAYISFSPRYRRSGIALGLDLLRGGVRGGEARKAIASWLAGGASVYMGVCHALAQDPDFDPNSGNFMTIEVGGMKVRLGGQYLTMMRLLANITATAQDNPERFISLDTRDQPLLKYLRGQSAPLMGLTTTLITGETYLGEPIVPWNKFVKNVVASTLMPFSLEPLFSDYPNDGYPAVPIEFGGLMTWPTSARSLVYEVLDKEAQAKYGMDYKELTKKDKKAALELSEIPEIKALQRLALLEEVTRGAGKEIRQQTIDWRVKFEEISETRSRTLYLAEAAYVAGKITETEYYYTIKTAGKQYSEASQVLQNEYPNVYKQWDKPHKAQKGESVHTMAYWDYQNLVYGDPQLNELEDEAYFARLEELEKGFKAKWGDEAYSYAYATTMAGKDLPPIYKARKADLKEIGMSGYWDLSRFGDDAMKQMFTFRQMNPSVDAALYTWGYVSTLQTQDAVDLARLKIQILNIPKGIPQALSQNAMDAEYDRLIREQESLSHTVKGTPTATDLQAMWDTRTSILGAVRNYESQLKMTTSPTRQSDILQKLDSEYAKLSMLYQMTQGYAQTHRDVRTRQFLNALERDMLEQTRRKSRVAAGYP